MSEDLFSELGRRLVIGRKRDGRSVYDPQVKLELIRACRESGRSVAKIARECGVNANQLTTWIRLDERGQLAATQTPPPLSFVPVRIEPAASESTTRGPVDLQARLPNGVLVELRGCDMAHVAELIEALGGLRCSASTKA
jgi:transposase